MIYRLFLLWLALVQVSHADIKEHVRGDLAIFASHFEVDNHFLADNFLSLMLKPERFEEFDKYSCELYLRIKYVKKNGEGFSVFFNELTSDQLFKQVIAINGVRNKRGDLITLEYGNFEKGCKKNDGFLKRYGFYFDIKEVIYEKQ